MTKFLSFSQKHQKTRNRNYRPSTPGVKAYSHSKAVRAFFLLLGKMQQQKRLTAGKSLFKPAAVKTARIMYSGAAAQGCAAEQHCRFKCA